MSLIRIVLGNNEALVFSPFEAKDLIKTMPIRAWVPGDKAWKIPTSHVSDLKDLLDQAGYMIVEIDRRTPGGEKPKAPPPPPPSSGDTETRLLRQENERLKRERQRLEQQVVRMRNETQAHASGWAEELLRKLTPEQAVKAHKRLATVLHPDVGGNAELMRDLNVAADRVADRSRR